MNLVVSSIFRDSADYLPRYFAQIEALRQHADVRLVLGEGDSTDRTPSILPAFLQPDDLILTANHGGPRFGSIDHPTRWAQIAQVVRTVIGGVRDPGDVFIWVESDLIWTAESMMDLAKADRCVTPMVLANGSDRFYDTYGMRQDGEMFHGTPPYLPHPPQHPLRYVPIDSCGSCFAIPAADFHAVKEWDGMWPFTCGGHLALDLETVIRHP